MDCTRLALVIGDPIQHSLSPPIVNAAFSDAGLDCKMLSLQVPKGKLDTALTAMRKLKLIGMSVTMPHKKAAAEAVDRLDEEAQMLGAVNCISMDESGELAGHNTDGDGFLWSLAQEQASLTQKSVLVFGAGGAAAAVALACDKAGANEVGILARSKAEALVQKLGGGLKTVESTEVKDFEILINATPLGMQHLITESPVQPEQIQKSHIVVDLVYSPSKTRFLKEAEARGAKIIGGLGMLAGQAARAIQIWTGVQSNPKAMQEAALGAIELRK